jgi:hypothetical protein
MAPLFCCGIGAADLFVVSRLLMSFVGAGFASCFSSFCPSLAEKHAIHGCS